MQKLGNILGMNNKQEQEPLYACPYCHQKMTENELWTHCPRYVKYNDTITDYLILTITIHYYFNLFKMSY